MSAYPFGASKERIVVTGGPGAGKTAVLELARREFCRHVTILPESASIVFSGGFPRHRDDVARRAAQRAIHYVQRELETIALSREQVRVALCDRGTIDALAYWPGPWAEFFGDIRSTMEAELARYSAVIHLRVPENAAMYRASEIRLESHQEALEIDRRLLEVWSGHPRRILVDGSDDFVLKAERALAGIRAELPNCCASAEPCAR